MQSSRTQKAAPISAHQEMYFVKGFHSKAASAFVAQLLIRAAGITMLSGCTINSEDVGDGSPITIAEASVIDSDGFTNTGASVSDVRPDDRPDQFFSLHWTVIGGRTPAHRADWFISADETLQADPAGVDVDVRILGRNCGIDFSDVCPGNRGDAACSYRTDRTVYCGDLGALADRRPTAVGPYFADTRGLPGRYYLLLRILDPANGDTVVRSFAVNFE